MNQEDYFDISSSSSSTSDLSEHYNEDHHHNHHHTTNIDINTSNFNSVYYSKQVETLKHLRQVLNENKILKKRLNLVESELEQYQDFKSIYPLKDLNNFEADSSLSEIDDNLLKTTEDKDCQTDSNIIITIPTSSTPTPPIPAHIEHSTPIIVSNHRSESSSDLKIINKEESSQFILNKIEPITQACQTDNTNNNNNNDEIKPNKTNKVSKKKQNVTFEVESPTTPATTSSCKTDKIDETTQTENDILYVKQIDQLKEEILLLNQLKENELTHLNSTNLELKIELENLKQKNETLTQDYDVISNKFNEYRLDNMDGEHELVLLRERNVEVLYGMDQLEKTIKSKDSLIESKQNEIELLKENNRILKETNKLIDEQHKQIEYLLAENDRHLKEKHVICQQKISELTNECNSYAEFIKTQNNEMKNQIDHINKLNLEIDKLKLDQQNFNFKEFVNLKRELNCLKQEKERQFANDVCVAAAQQPNSISNAVVLAQQPLPPIKESKKNYFKFFN